MTKEIKGADFPLARIFSSDFDYVIPSYQRPYACTPVQAGELFSDLYDFYTKEDKAETYFRGKQSVSSYVLTTQVLNSPSWTPVVVEQRQKDLMDVLSTSWGLK